MLRPRRLCQPDSLGTSAGLRFVSDLALEDLEGREYHSSRKDPKDLEGLLDQPVLRGRWCLPDPLRPLHPLLPQDPPALADRLVLLRQPAQPAPSLLWVLPVHQPHEVPRSP